MKKFKIIGLIVIGICVFAFCFVVSKFVFCKFNMTSDYLTASATFFAALVAFYLFNDWRKEQRFVLMEKYQSKIEDEIHELNSKYNAARILIVQSENKIANEKELKSFFEIMLSIEILKNSIKKYSIFVNDYSGVNLIVNNHIEDVEKILIILRSLQESSLTYIKNNKKPLDNEALIKFLLSDEFTSLFHDEIPEFTTALMTYLKWRLDYPE